MRNWILLLAIAISGYSEISQRVYFEPDFSYRLKHTYESEDFVQRGSGQLFGFNAGYELLAYSFFSGIETLISFGNSFDEVIVFDEVTNYEGRLSKNKIESRFGYRFQAGDLALTPFIGAGDYFLTGGTYRNHIVFIPLGFRTEYQTRNYCLGIRVEQLHYLHEWISTDHSESRNMWGQYPFGYEVSLPVSIKGVVLEGQWYASIEPYYLYLFSNSRYLGGRVSATYNF